MSRQAWDREFSEAKLRAARPDGKMSLMSGVAWENIKD